MEEIKLSELQNSQRRSIKNAKIIPDVNFNNPYLISFEACEFHFLGNNAIVEIGNCKNCKFYGVSSESEKLGSLHIKDATDFTSNEISGFFSHIIFTNVWIISLKDTSSSSNFNINSSHIEGSKIEGGCNHLILNDVYFTSSNSNIQSIWNKMIRKTAICTKTTFASCKLYPFYLKTKCADKSSLDLTKATIVDNWAMLRKKYAGLSLFIIFFLTFLFFLPLLTNTFFLLTLKNIDIPVPNIQKLPLWEALLYGGKQGLWKVTYATLTVLLLIYNLLRLFVTIQVAKLKEEELFLKDSGFQLASIHPDKIKPYLKIDKWLNILFWISISYTFFKLIDTLFIIVPVYSS